MLPLAVASTTFSEGNTSAILLQFFFVMCNQFNIDTIDCILTVMKNNAVPLFPQILMNVLLEESSAHDLGTVSILLEATFAGVIKALI